MAFIDRLRDRFGVEPICGVLRERNSYQRLQYLRLHKSLTEAKRKILNYQGNIRKDKVVVAGANTLRELNDYRDDIAHWWTGSIDENFLSDLRRTVNQLIRRRYFRR